MSSSRSLLGLRLLQLVRPVLIIAALRYFDVGMAAQYVAMLGVYVIALEIYNVVAPSDRLYLPESSVADLVAVVRRRAQYAALVVPISALVMVVWVGLSWVVAGILAFLSCLNAFSTALSAYLYGRVPARALRVAEVASWLVQLAAVLLLLLGGSVLWGFVAYALEQTVRAAFLAWFCERGTLLQDHRLSTGAQTSMQSVSAMALEGLTLTAANHVHRVPFVVAVGQIDPLFVVAAQVSAAVYNVLIGVSSRLPVPARYGLYLVAALGLIAGFLLAGHLTAPRLRLLAQTGLLCALAVLHGGVMTHIPGQAGMGAYRGSRWFLIAGLAAVIGVGSTLSHVAFLASPLVLILAGMIFSRRSHAKV
jgi:hypothetical protein